MNRRDTLLALAAHAAAPLAAQAKSTSKMSRIGLLGGSSRTSRESSHIWDGLFQGLRDLGWFEGQNLVVEGRFYGDRVDRLPALAGELVGLRPDVIVAGAAPAPEAARRATSTIPIVMINHSDPMGSGLVTSLANPGGNVTGMSLNTLALRGKQLQLLKEAVPSLTSVAVLVNPTVAFDAIHLREVEAAARTLMITPHAVEARVPSDFEAAFSAATKHRVAGLVVLGCSMVFAHREALAELASMNRLPAIYGLREHVDVGGLMSYGVDIRDSARRAAAYVDKILKGARPADLPVEQPTRFYLTVNLTTAKALGLTIPQSLLLRADEVIE